MANKTKNESKFSWDFFDIVEGVISVTVLLVIVVSLFFRMTVVQGESMEETLHDGEYLLVRDIFYTPERGDIVVVNDPSKSDFGGLYSEPLVKRVIAVAGDTLEIKTGVVFLNGRALEEDYINEHMRPESMAPITIPENEIFVMGDNRNHSGDSRTFGTVDVRCVVGKAFFRVFPFNTISYLKSAEG